MNNAYPLKPYRVPGRETQCAMMRMYPLATLVTGTVGRANMTLVPMLVETDEANGICLSGHLDRNNDQANDLVPGAPVSFQFRGPDTYVSPDLYPTPHLPGWLYLTVQGDGEVSEILSEEKLMRLLVQSTAEFGNGQQRFSLDASDPRIGRLISGIMGFRIKVTRIAGIGKLAQDKGPVESRMAMEFLAEQGNHVSLPLFERIMSETLPRERK